MTLVIAVVNLKGGTTKTTTSAFLAHAFHEAEQRVLGVDTDAENESFVGWSGLADFPFPVVGMAVPNLHTRLPGVMGDRYDVVVIDTPPMQEQRTIVAAALRLADYAVIPMAPTSMDYSRVHAIREVAEEVAPLRPLGKPPVTALLLTKVKTQAASARVYREMATEDGFTVLNAQVAALERFAQAYPAPIVNAMNTSYGDAATELLSLEVAA